jgi:hypothetical protein
MLDRNTLKEIEKYVDNRIRKLKESMALYTKQDFQYLVYKNLIMEMQNEKVFIKKKLGE